MERNAAFRTSCRSTATASCWRENTYHCGVRCPMNDHEPTSCMNYLFAICASAVLLGSSGCKKQEAPPVSTEVFGEWQWVSSVGGITGKNVLTPAITGVARTYRFDRDSTVVECDNGQCEAAVKFTLRMETSFFDHQQHLILTIPHTLHLPPPTGVYVIRSRYTVREVSNSLRLTEEVADGYEEVYNRK